MHRTITSSATLTLALVVGAAATTASAQFGNLNIVHGVVDGFNTALPVWGECAEPSHGLKAYLTGVGVTVYGDFDGTAVNTHIADTFNSLPTGIVRCTLTMYLRPNGFAENDAVNLTFVDCDGVIRGKHWNCFIGAGQSTPGLLPLAWNPTNYPLGATITIDLRNLPLGNTTVADTDLCPTIGTAGYLDFWAQDDTGVDALVLVPEGNYANCDGSTAPPMCNVLDFSCFLNKYAAGCVGCP